MVEYNKNWKREIDYLLPWLFDWLDTIYLTIRLNIILICSLLLALIVSYLLYDKFGLLSYFVGSAIIFLGMKAQFNGRGLI